MIVRAFPKKTQNLPKWQVAKLLHPTPDEDAWVVQWCNTADTGPAYRMDRKFKLVWLKSDGSEEEHYAMNAQPGWLPVVRVDLLVS